MMAIIVKKGLTSRLSECRLHDFLCNRLTWASIKIIQLGSGAGRDGDGGNNRNVWKREQVFRFVFRLCVLTIHHRYTCLRPLYLLQFTTARCSRAAAARFSLSFFFHAELIVAVHLPASPPPSPICSFRDMRVRSSRLDYPPDNFSISSASFSPFVFTSFASWMRVKLSTKDRHLHPPHHPAREGKREREKHQNTKRRKKEEERGRRRRRC